MKKLQSLQSSNWTYDSISHKKDKESRTALGKKKKRNQNETNPRSLKNKTSYETNFRDSDSDHYSENSIALKNADIKEDARELFPISNTDKVKLFGNRGSTDLSELASKSMDVVVDIHREYKEERSLSENIKRNEATRRKLENLSTKELEDSKVFSKTNIIRGRRIERSKINSIKHQNVRRDDDDIKVVSSLDLIEEFRESPVKKLEEKRIEVARNNKLIKKNIDRSVEEKFHGRKQWAAPKDRIEELRKPARKRWSKDTTVIRLPEARGNSWAASLSENSVGRNLEQPLPATRLSSKQKSSFAFDNAAFDSENEEILRIETDHNEEDTKIEMKEIVQELEQISSFGSRSSRDSSSKENESFKETAIVIEDLNEPANLDSRSFENRNNNAILDIKHIYEFNRDDASSKSGRKKSSVKKDEKNVSDNSNVSQSLEEITAQSDDRSSQEASTKDDQRLINKRNKRGRKKRFVKDERHFEERSVSGTENYDLENRSRHSNQRSTTTSEDDDFDGDRCGETRDEVKLKRSNTSKKKSKYTEHQSEMQQKRDKKKRLGKNVSNSSMHAQSVNVEEDSRRKKKKKKKKNDVKYISVTIHRTDMLEIDYVTKHPMVKVHVVKAETGKYLRNEYGASTYLQPVITGKFDFKENKSIIPVWEEELVFEHDFCELLKTDNEQVVILFEIVDLLSFAEASFNYDKFGKFCHESCWYKVAWAFLKPVGRNNVLHIDKKVRLQLYKPRKSSQKFGTLHTCEVYTWWKSIVREKYPSSLFVTVTSIDPPKLEPVFYRQLSLHDLSNTRNESQKTSTRTSDSINLPKWTRLAAQSCKIPNETFFETDTSENGCFYVTFSNDGKYLACSLSEEHDYPIVVYEVETKKIHVQFSGHKTFIYSLNWSDNDNYLLSASSDQTARIWDVQNQIVQHIEMMPHPSYVYCAKFDPENSSIVATGCYDRIARIWIRDRKSKNRDLSQELEGHEGYINSMCFQKNSNLLTADSVGVIIIWILKRNRRLSSRKEWHISRKIKVREIDGIIINTIVLHPLESRLLVHSRNNGLRMLDLATGVALQKYNELNNQRIQSTACISPCGSLILCGGEDASLNAWNLETGSLLAKYTFHRNYRAVTCVDYHPYDHVLAFSTFGSPAPVRILRFNKDATGEDVGLKIMPETENTVNSGDISMRFLNTSVMPEEKSRSSDKKETIEEASNERSLKFNRNYDSSLLKSSDSALLGRDKYNDAKIKLQRLNEAGQTLKSRSANRLYNIIEKIDRILSNTSRSSGDIESGRNLTLPQELSDSKVLTNLNENVEKQKRKSRKDRSAYLSGEDRSNSYFESSTTSSDKQRVVECYTLQDLSANNWNARKRSKSAKETRSSNVSRDDMSRTFSDSAANYHKNKIYDEIAETLSQENIESNFTNETKENDRKIYYRNNRFKNEDSNSSDSTGTYTIEKSDLKNSDKDSIQMFENDLVLDNTQNDLNVKHFESDSSVRSNATFTIENEVPVPKPRKKSKSSLK